MFALLLASPLAVLAADEPPLDSRAARTRLSNGLELVVLPIDSPGLAAMQAWVDVGSRWEVAAGTTGYAHFFEHLMFHGTPSLPQKAREDRLLELAVAENAWTSEDDTCYHLLLPAKHLPEVLAMEADRFRALTLGDAGVRREAGAVQGEFRKSRSHPERILEETLWSTAFSTHGYAHSTLGVEADVAVMPDGLATARAFFATFYRPERTRLVVVGDVRPDEVQATVERTWGAWTGAAGASPPLPVPEEPPQTAERRATVTFTAGETSPRLAIAWKIPAWSPSSVGSAAYEVACDLLASRVAPLRRLLVEEEALAWSLTCTPTHTRDPGLLSLVAEVRAGADLGRVETAMLDAVRALATGDEAVATARERLRRAAVLALDSPESWAFEMGAAAAAGGTVDAWAAALSRVTAADVARARDSLTAERRTVVTLVPGDPP